MMIEVTIKVLTKAPFDNAGTQTVKECLAIAMDHINSAPSKIQVILSKQGDLEGHISLNTEDKY